MTSTGGSLIEITFNHSVLGNGSFNPMASEDSTFDAGGFRNDDDQDRVTGNGEAVYSKTNKRWMLEAVCANDMNVRNDVEGTLVALAESDIEADWTISHINGTVWQGKGKPVGDIQWNGMASTFTLKVSGGGKMTKIVG